MKQLFLILLTVITTPLIAQTTEEVTLETGEGTLAGVLTIPDNCNNCTVILLISGSGANDRDGNSAMGVTANPFLLLSNELVESGIATLRFDKYLSGKSTLSIPYEKLSFDHYVNGFEAWLGLLLPDQRFGKVGILGHSQGALVGAIITARQPEIDFYISLSGSGTPADKLVVEQLEAQSPPLAEEAKAIFEALGDGEEVTEISPTMMTILPPPVHTLFRTWMVYDPAKEIAKVTKPILIINGTEDLQTKEKEAEQLAAAQPEAKLVIIKNMNHILKEVEEEAPAMANFGTYSNPDLPIHKELVPAIVLFLQE